MTNLVNAPDPAKHQPLVELMAHPSPESVLRRFFEMEKLQVALEHWLGGGPRVALHETLAGEHLVELVETPPGPNGDLRSHAKGRGLSYQDALAAALEALS